MTKLTCLAVRSLDEERSRARSSNSIVVSEGLVMIACKSGRPLRGWIEASYRRFIERRLREEFSFPGTPVQVAVRVKERD